jgi:hypothetical protein
MRNTLATMKRFDFARAVDASRRHDPRIAGQLPSTKGKL